MDVSYAYNKTWKQTCSNEGCGLPLQKFDNVQVAFLNIESFACSLNCASNGTKAPWPRTKSRHLGESPAIFPNAQTAYNGRVKGISRIRNKWIVQQISLNMEVSSIIMNDKQIEASTCSLTSSVCELKSFTNIGTAPWSITTLVFSDVPEAIFVKAHAASN